MPKIYGKLSRIIKPPAGALVCSLFLVSCASKGVFEENRNTDGSYDGTWVGKIAQTPDKAYIENWRINCWDMAGQVRLKVEDGKIVSQWRNFLKTSYVDNDGWFRIFMPHSEQVKNKISNESSLSGGLNYIIIGSLADGKLSGRLTMGYEALANQGCSSRVRFARN